MRVVLESELDFQIALAATKRRVRLVSLSTVGGVWFAAAAAWLLVFVIVDHAMSAGVPDLFRYPVCALFWIGSISWLALAGVLPLARKINDLYIARLIENSHPEFRNALVDAIQISQHEELPGSIRAAVMDRAARDITCIEPARCVPLYGLRRAARACVFATAIFVVYGLLAPKDVWPSLLRGLGFDLRSPTYTRIVGLSPADGASVLTGKPVTFSAELAGRRPDAAFVRFSFDDGVTWSTGQQMPLIPPTREDSDSQWQAIKAGRDMRQSMVWQVIAGDAVSERRHIEVRPVPAITDVSVEYNYAPQSQLPPTTRPGGDIDAPRDTQVIIRAATNVEAFNSLLILGRPPEERRRVLDVTAEGAHELRIPLTVAEDDEYRIEFRDAYGEPNPDPVRYTIRVRGEEGERVATSAPPPVEEVAEAAESEPVPAESEPANDQIAKVRRVKDGSSETAATQSAEGEWVASTAPEGDDQPTIQVASVADGHPRGETMDLRDTDTTTGENLLDLDGTPASGPAPNKAEFADRHQRELAFLAEHLLEPSESMLNEATSSESEMSPAKTSEASDQGESTETAENGGESSEGANGSASGQGESAGQSAGAGKGDSGQASGDGTEGSQGQGSEGQGEAQGQSSDGQGKGQGQGAAQGERDSSSEKPEQPKPGQQPSGSGASAGGGSGDGSAPPASESGEGTGSQPTESLGQGSGSSWRAATVGQARQAIDALERDLRQGQIDPGLLDELGWDVPAAQRFVESYKRSANRPPPVNDDSATRPAPGRPQAAASPHRSERVLRATGQSAPGVGGLYDTDTRPADDTRDLMQPGQQRVPARYEPILKAYYETLTSQPAH